MMRVYRIATNGTLSIIGMGDSWVYVKNGSHSYKADGPVSNTYNHYVDIPCTTSGTLGFLLCNINGDTVSEQTSDAPNLSINPNIKNYFVSTSTSRTGAQNRYSIDIDNTISADNYNLPTGPASGYVRIWIRNRTDWSGTLNIHTWTAHSTSWPGIATTSYSLAPKTTGIKLAEGSTFANADKINVPAGDRTLSLSYNSDGTLLFSYE